MSTINFAFFGSSRLSVIVLDEMKRLGYVPTLIITTPDKPQGRKMTLTPNVVKSWALHNNIEVLDPAKLDANFVESIKKRKFDVYIVASYGKIMPETLINIPDRKTLNIHPSLLPKYRGASPLPTAMLEDAKKTGISIMRMDKEMDHGPIIAQKEISVGEWPTYEEFEEMMAREGAGLLVSILPDWIADKIQAREQDHGSATYTRKITKKDGLINLDADPYQNFRKIQAFHQWPQAYFVIVKSGKELRVKITSTSFADGKLVIEKVIPEGSKEMSYKDFLSGYSKT